MTLQRWATSCAASMAAYGDDSSLSALTFMPPIFTKEEIDQQTAQAVKRSYLLKMSTWAEAWKNNRSTISTVVLHNIKTTRTWKKGSKLMEPLYVL